MPTSDRALLLQPASLDFGNVQVGDVAKHSLVLVNNNPNSLSFNMKVEAKDSYASFYTSLTSQGEFKPFERKELTVSFRPTVSGAQRQVLVMSIQGGAATEQVTLLGMGTPAHRNSLRRVDLPPRRIEKEGRHYVLAISNSEYIQRLEVEEGTRLNYYTALSSGTRNGKVTRNSIPDAGEHLLSPQISATDDWSMLNCFDVQQIKYEWTTRIGRTITERPVIDDINEAIRHTTDACQKEKRPCRHRLSRHDPRLIPFLENPPKAGEIIEIIHSNGSIKGVVISSPEVCARYERCFKMRAALVVDAELAEHSDKTNLYSVRTSPILGESCLWIPCYTASICSLVSETNYEVKPLNVSLSDEDLKSVRERVLLYLGIET